MSYKRSVFPEGGYDTFIELYDLPPSYEPLVLEFSQLRAKENKTPTEELRFNELTNILQNYIIDTDKWNKFCDAVTGLQKFFLENTQGYIDTLKVDVNSTVANGKAEIDTTKDNALIAIENKKENIINYMDETTAGAIRNDIGVMGDSTIEGRSLIDKTNKLKSDVDAIDDKIDILNGAGEAKEKANKTEFDEYKADYAYQTPIIVGTQIRITKQSSTNRLYFKLDDDLFGNITISLDNGTTSKNIRDVYGFNVEELEKGFVEVVAEATFFTLVPKGGKKIEDVDYTITSNGGQFLIPKGLHSGEGLVKAQFANLLPGNIKKDVNVGGVVGDLGSSRLIRGEIYVAARSNVVITLDFIPNFAFAKVTKSASNYNLFDQFTPDRFFQNQGDVSLSMHHTSLTINNTGTQNKTVSYLVGIVEN